MRRNKGVACQRMLPTLGSTLLALLLAAANMAEIPQHLRYSALPSTRSAPGSKEHTHGKGFKGTSPPSLHPTPPTSKEHTGKGFKGTRRR